MTVQHRDSGGDLGGEFLNLDGEAPEMVNETGRQVGHEPRQLRQEVLDLVVGACWPSLRMQTMASWNLQTQVSPFVGMLTGSSAR